MRADFTDSVCEVAPVVSAVEVTKRWSSTQALAGATFTIGGGVTGLLGANGAGKTTLIGLLLGLYKPDTGSVTVLGGNPWDAGPAIRARLGYAPEHEALPPDVAAHDVVRHLAELHGLPGAKPPPGRAMRYGRSGWARSASGP